MRLDLPAPSWTGSVSCRTSIPAEKPDCARRRFWSSSYVCCCCRPNVPTRRCCCGAAAVGHPMRTKILCHLCCRCCCCCCDGGGGGDGGDDDRKSPYLFLRQSPPSIRSPRSSHLPSSCNERNCCRPCRPLRRRRFCCRHRRNCRLQ